MTVSTRTLQRAAAWWIFPGLVFAMVAGNEGWRLGPLALGQVVSWINDASAVALVLGRFPDRWWVRALIGATLAAKLMTIAGVAPRSADLGFDVGLGLLFCAAGAILVSERPGIAYKQALVIGALSIPVMLAQMVGVSPAFEALNTEHTEDPPELSATIFVPEADLHYRTAQARPSGFTHANNFLSLLAIFALALQFSRLRTPYLTWRDTVVVTFAILTMAKVSLLVLVTLLLWKAASGTSIERRRTARIATYAGLALAAYALVFPGLFVANINFYKVSYSFYIRANDFAGLLPDDSLLKGWLREQLAGTPKAERMQGAGLSGYAQIIHLLPYLVAVAAVVVPLFLTGIDQVKRRYASVVGSTIPALIVILLYPAAVPMFRAQIYWFMAGFALLPCFVLWEPRRFSGPRGHLRAPVLRAASTS